MLEVPALVAGMASGESAQLIRRVETMASERRRAADLEQNNWLPSLFIVIRSARRRMRNLRRQCRRSSGYQWRFCGSEGTEDRCC